MLLEHASLHTFAKVFSTHVRLQRSFLLIRIVTLSTNCFVCLLRELGAVRELPFIALSCADSVGVSAVAMWHV